MLHSKFFRSILVGAALMLPVMTGCAEHVSAGYRVYDPYYGDYHVWGPDENVYYNRWVGERHMEHREFRRLNKRQQREYWTWRHGQH
jgi:hypothetical protein